MSASRDKSARLSSAEYSHFVHQYNTMRRSSRVALAPAPGLAPAPLFSAGAGVTATVTTKSTKRARSSSKRSPSPSIHGSARPRSRTPKREHEHESVRGGGRRTKDTKETKDLEGGDVSSETKGVLIAASEAAGDASHGVVNPADAVPDESTRNALLVASFLGSQDPQPAAQPAVGIIDFLKVLAKGGCQTLESLAAKRIAQGPLEEMDVLTAAAKHYGIAWQGSTKANGDMSPGILHILDKVVASMKQKLGAAARETSKKKGEELDRRDVEYAAEIDAADTQSASACRSERDSLRSKLAQARLDAETARIELDVCRASGSGSGGVGSGGSSVGESSSLRMEEENVDTEDRFLNAPPSVEACTNELRLSAKTRSDLDCDAFIMTMSAEDFLSFQSHLLERSPKWAETFGLVRQFQRDRRTVDIKRDDYAKYRAGIDVSNVYRKSRGWEPVEKLSFSEWYIKDTNKPVFAPVDALTENAYFLTQKAAVKKQSKLDADKDAADKELKDAAYAAGITVEELLERRRLEALDIEERLKATRAFMDGSPSPADDEAPESAAAKAFVTVQDILKKKKLGFNELRLASMQDKAVAGLAAPTVDWLRGTFATFSRPMADTEQEKFERDYNAYQSSATAFEHARANAKAVKGGSKRTSPRRASKHASESASDVADLKELQGGLMLPSASPQSLCLEQGRAALSFCGAALLLFVSAALPQERQLNVEQRGRLARTLTQERSALDLLGYAGYQTAQDAKAKAACRNMVIVLQDLAQNTMMLAEANAPTFARDMYTLILCTLAAQQILQTYVLALHSEEQIHRAANIHFRGARLPPVLYGLGHETSRKRYEKTIPASFGAALSDAAARSHACVLETLSVLVAMKAVSFDAAEKEMTQMELFRWKLTAPLDDVLAFDDL